jgi:hypothetical protein
VLPFTPAFFQFTPRFIRHTHTSHAAARQPAGCFSPSQTRGPGACLGFFIVFVFLCCSSFSVCLFLESRACCSLPIRSSEYAVPRCCAMLLTPHVHEIFCMCFAHFSSAFQWNQVDVCIFELFCQMTLLFWFGKEKLNALFDSNIRTRSETTEKRQASSDRIVRMCHVI